MRTPAGKECRYYYQDFHRGRAVQECRLIKGNPESLPWRESFCGRCPVPDILNANSSPHLELSLTVRPVMLGLGRRLDVQAQCDRHHIAIEDAYVGCPQCNAERPGLDVFLQALENDDETDSTSSAPVKE
ncbi:MAG: hypothetical protein SF162_14650 [bacterium]|nr:hypothetical protein [bacterium]